VIFGGRVSVKVSIPGLATEMHRRKLQSEQEIMSPVNQTKEQRYIEQVTATLDFQSLPYDTKSCQYYFGYVRARYVSVHLFYRG